HLRLRRGAGGHALGRRRPARGGARPAAPLPPGDALPHRALAGDRARPRRAGRVAGRRPPAPGGPRGRAPACPPRRLARRPPADPAEPRTGPAAPARLPHGDPLERRPHAPRPPARARDRHLFDTVVSSAEEGLAKPEPAIYRLAAERLGLDVTACVFIDDHEDNVRAAEAAGMRGVLYRVDRDPDLAARLAALGVVPGQPPHAASRL